MTLIDRGTPHDAAGTYRSYQGDTWIKDVDLSTPSYPMAYVWSWTAKRWRKKRQMIDMKRVTLFEK